MKLRSGIAEHDFEFEARHVRRFLETGDRVRLTVEARGRQASRSRAGREVLNRMVRTMAGVGRIESGPTVEGGTTTVVLIPKRKNR